MSSAVDSETAAAAVSGVTVEDDSSSQLKNENTDNLLLSTLSAAQNHPSTTSSTSRMNQVTNQNAAVDGGSESGADLWSDILNSVKSQRAVPSKNLILLGEPSTGKSTLLSLLSKNSPNSFMSNLIQNHFSTNGDRDQQDKSDNNKSSSTGLDDLGLTYGYFDVGEGSLGDGDEIIARLGIYKLSSSHPSYVSLLPLSLPSTSTSSSTTNQSISNSRNGGSSSKLTGSIETLKDSLIMITLDWENPWSFLEQLRTWLDVVRELVDGISRGGLKSDRERENEKVNGNHVNANEKGGFVREKVVLEEMMERLEIYIRSYSEPQSSIPVSTLSLSGNDASTPKIEELPTPSNNNSSSIIPINHDTLDGLTDDVLPLGEGTLTSNWGVGIVVVCTKADTIPKLERERSFKEEQFDYIQQVLRTVCLKYGAALFYTARSKPESIEVLRSYILHRLFIPTTSSSNPTNTTSSSNLTPTKTGPTFSFPHKASTIEREVLLVPSGWDSFGKINALREGFDCKSMGNGWDYDCEIEKFRREKGILERNRKIEESLEKELLELQGGGEGMDDRGSAVRWFEDVVADWKTGPPVDSNQNKVKPPDAQHFLSLHHSTLQKDEDPRTKFSRTSSSSSTTASNARSSNVVGPMGSSALSLPSVEKVVNDGSKDGYVSAGRDERSERPREKGEKDRERHRDRDGRERESDRATPRISRKESRSQRLESPSLGSSNGPSSSSPGSTSPGGPRQSEVLHDFFQSLLKPGGDKSSTPGRSDKDRERRGTSSNTKTSASKSNSSSTDANLSAENLQ